ncbi:MAG: glycosyltransferase family 9 protein, partial [Ghiorsea sp.]|nr:glycosyltransferase family 9 protein [Ghiorsea sp.]
MKVLIVKLSAFGDIIHALPALDDVLARPEVNEVHWLVDSRFAFAAEVLPAEVTVHHIALKGEHPIREVRRVVKQLRAENFDFALDFQGLIKSSVLARLICKKVYGFDASIIREKPASWFEHSSMPHSDEINIVQQVRRVAQSPWLKGEGREGEP